MEASKSRRNAAQSLSRKVQKEKEAKGSRKERVQRHSRPFRRKGKRSQRSASPRETANLTGTMRPAEKVTHGFREREKTNLNGKIRKKGGKGLWALFPPCSTIENADVSVCFCRENGRNKGGGTGATAPVP